MNYLHFLNTFCDITKKIAMCFKLKVKRRDGVQKPVQLCIKKQLLIPEYIPETHFSYLSPIVVTQYPEHIP